MKFPCLLGYSKLLSHAFRLNDSNHEYDSELILNNQLCLPYMDDQGFIEAMGKVVSISQFNS